VGIHWLRVGAVSGILENYAVLGLDPGTWTVGVAILGANCGYTTHIRASKAPPLDRVADLYAQYCGLLQWVNNVKRPLSFVVGIEMPTVYADQGNTAVRLGDVRGALIVATCLGLDYPIVGMYDIAPSSAKVALAKDGHASKEQMIAAAKELWVPWEKGMRKDEADALGIALAAWKRYVKEKGDELRPPDIPG